MIKKKFKEYFLTVYIALNSLFVMFGSFLFNKRESLTMYKFSRMMISLLVLNLFIVVVHIIKLKVDKKKIRFRLFDTFLIFIFIFSLISAILSIHTESAFFGFRGRYEGFFQIMYYFSLFLLSSFLDEEKKKIVSHVILAVGVIESLYAHCQVFKFFNVFTQYHHHKPWATGFATNPNFFGSLMILSLSIAIGLFFDIKGKKTKGLYLTLMFIIMSGLLISNTLSALVGLIMVLIYVLIYAIIKKKIKPFIIVVVVLSSITVIQTYNHKTYLIKDLIKTKNQSVEIAKGNAKDNYGSNRMFIWKNTLKVVPNNLTYGVGIDNFYYAFGDKPLTIKGCFFDKAHNEYLQVLVCEGIYALIFYLLFFGVITIYGIKYSYKKNKLYLILPVGGYLVQAFFNISVIEVAPFFYIVLGLCASRDDEKELLK